MRILVTGGAGYIGSITTHRLLEAGHDVLVVDSLIRGHRDAVDRRATFVDGEIGDPSVMEQVLPGCDAVMHLAGLIEVAESQSEPGRYFDANVAQPARMLDAMVEHGVGAIVFSSTAAVYGEPSSVPIPEEAATHPVNVYGATKLMFERLLDWYGSAHGIRSIRLRYFNVAGAMPDGSLGEAHDPETHIIPRVLMSLREGRREFEVFGGDYPTPDGTCVRDYIHVCDLAEAHRLSLERLGIGEEGGVFNLGNGAGYSNLEVVRTCAEAAGRDIEVAIGPRRPGDPAVLVASAARATDVLGWRPASGDLRTIIGDAWRWHTR
ncbi:MAG: UDP-glucose 4-epimerase GalE [Anaerosomatales bacterium]|nr:UDP-glucose 4-epimerase GalE [Anaerosomatales bacterium]MDT8433508.1 UDP-glucose 4-epimerase GalE [Anaerosomatales bacterium]